MAEFAPIYVATVKANVDMNSQGFIAQTDDTVTAAKIMSIPGIKAQAGLADTKKVYDAFLGITGGNADELSYKRTITQGVTQDG